MFPNGLASERARGYYANIKYRIPFILPKSSMNNYTRINLHTVNLFGNVSPRAYNIFTASRLLIVRRHKRPGEGWKKIIENRSRATGARKGRRSFAAICRSVSVINWRVLSEDRRANAERGPISVTFFVAETQNVSPMTTGFVFFPKSFPRPPGLYGICRKPNLT